MRAKPFTGDFALNANLFNADVVAIGDGPNFNRNVVEAVANPQTVFEISGD